MTDAGRLVPEVVTIGVYGATEAGFFRALVDASVDTFVDIRRRRGMRGADYAFANSLRLQQQLERLGIRYLHFKSLAPTNTIREEQKREDILLAVSKRKREGLGDAFTDAYRRSVLDRFSPDELLRTIPSDARVVAFFCVERAAAACHRSLVADYLARAWSIQPRHIQA